MKMLSVHDANKLVHTFVSFRLDYCNALLSEHLLKLKVVYFLLFYCDI